MTDLSTSFPSLAGILLSLAFAYVPGLEGWYAGLSTIGKRLVMLVLLVLVAVAYLIAACSAIAAQLGIPADVCTQAGIVTVVQAFIAALIANQATFSLAVNNAKG